MTNAHQEFHRAVAWHLTESARVKRVLAGAAVEGALRPGAAVVASARTAAEVSRGEGPSISKQQIGAIVAAAETVAGSFRAGGKLLLCGNGGSAADCQHVATEFTNILDKSFRRGPLPAMALTTDSSFLTAFANDYQAFEQMFSRQIEALGKRGDVLMAISTSGASPNILHAVQTAQAMGIKSIGLLGASGKLAPMCDLAISVPSSRTAHIQEAHLAIEHIICDLVERMLFPERRPTPLESADGMADEFV